ncbi:cytochrome c biogenesis protein ResB [Thauera sp. WH-2]|uniref:cytochrome c biogenesis protein ResB n=1 Tax=unclassified Thauera TaxID=2609274 RepID=UPI003AAF3308
MQRGTARALFELLSSMRFAIALLTILSIASVIGTVVKQNDPLNAYLNQFGPFWFPVFEKLGLYSVYNAGWFIVILAFLVLSTSLCIVRQTAPMLREIRSFREHAREASLRQFAHRASLSATLDLPEAQTRIEEYLRQHRFNSRSNARSDGALIAAKQGSIGRVGYFFAHGAIVLICVGGLLDGDLPLRVTTWLGDKQPTAANQLIADIPESARLDLDNPSFRGDVYIPEGRTTTFAVLRAGDGILLQELPFNITLERFHIDHYENGMPKRFASDIVVANRMSGESTAHTIEVNKPLTLQGITLYQSSFEDGGSRLRLVARSLLPGRAGVLTELEGAVGENLPFHDEAFRYTLEFIDFKAFNVEDLATGEGADVQSAKGLARLEQHLGSGARTVSPRDMRNVGPSFTYRLRDEAGQAREFHNYMLPIEQDGRWFLYTGLRDSQADSFRYMRIPLDEAGSVDTWFAVRNLLLDPTQRAQLAQRFAARTFAGGQNAEAMRAPLAQSAVQTLELFAERGYETLGAFIERTVPEAERGQAADVLVRVLQGAAWEAWMQVRADAGLDAAEVSPARATYVNDSIAAISDSLFYGSPAYLQLDSFEERLATVLQATRSPGQPLVYIGSLLLVLGVFAMLYIRERRFFVLVKANEILVAMSSNRKALDVDETFQRHVEGLAAALRAAPPAPVPESVKGA